MIKIFDIMLKTEILQEIYNYGLTFNNYSSARDQKYIISKCATEMINSNKNIKNTNIIQTISDAFLIGFNNNINNIKILFDSGCMVKYVFSNKLIKNAQITKSSNGINTVIIIPVNEKILYLPIINEKNIIIKNNQDYAGKYHDMNIDILIGIDIMKFLKNEYKIMQIPILNKNFRISNYQLISYHTKCIFNENQFAFSIDSGLLDDEFHLSLSIDFYNTNKNLLKNTNTNYIYKNLFGPVICNQGEIDIEISIKNNSIKLLNLKFIVFGLNAINQSGIPIHLVGSKKLIELLISEYNIFPTADIEFI